MQIVQQSKPKSQTSGRHLVLRTFSKSANLLLKLLPNSGLNSRCLNVPKFSSDSKTQRPVSSADYDNYLSVMPIILINNSFQNLSKRSIQCIPNINLASSFSKNIVFIFEVLF